MKKARRIAILFSLVAAAGLPSCSFDKETRGLLATMPTGGDVLFWNQAQRDAGFRALDRMPLVAKSRVVPAGGDPDGAPLSLPLDLDAYLAGQRSAALLIVHDGKLRLERYGLDFDAAGRWTSFSVAKSVTATLAGAALRERLHRQHGRQGEPLHPRDEGLGLRRRQRPPAPHHDGGRALERELRRSQLRCGQSLGLMPSGCAAELRHCPYRPHPRPLYCTHRRAPRTSAAGFMSYRNCESP